MVETAQDQKQGEIRYRLDQHPVQGCPHGVLSVHDCYAANCELSAIKGINSKISQDDIALTDVPLHHQTAFETLNLFRPQQAA